jgi:TonB family protein
MKSRSVRNIHFNSTVLLSLLLHALFLSIIVLSPSLPEKKWTFGPVYSVDLVSAPVGSSESRPAVHMSKELVNQSQEPIALSKKNSADQILKPLSPMRNEKSDIEKAIENVKKRVAASSNAPSPSQGSEINAGMQAYYARIWSRIKGQWAMAQGVLPNQNLEAVINIVILKDGTLSNLNIERGSGNKYFDQSAARAIRKASPFPPLPNWVKDHNLEIGLRFLSSELN